MLLDGFVIPISLTGVGLFLVFQWLKRLVFSQRQKLQVHSWLGKIYMRMYAEKNVAIAASFTEHDRRKF